jgi:hypothetical protein
VNYKLIGIFLGTAFVLYFVASQPTESYHLVHGALAGVGDAAGKLAEYVRRLVR